jgi:hypothetical protein
MRTETMENETPVARNEHAVYEEAQTKREGWLYHDGADDTLPPAPLRALYAKLPPSVHVKDILSTALVENWFLAKRGASASGQRW